MLPSTNHMTNALDQKIDRILSIQEAFAPWFEDLELYHQETYGSEPTMEELVAIELEGSDYQFEIIESI